MRPAATAVAPALLASAWAFPLTFREPLLTSVSETTAALACCAPPIMIATAFADVDPVAFALAAALIVPLLVSDAMAEVPAVTFCWIAAPLIANRRRRRRIGDAAGRNRVAFAVTLIAPLLLIIALPVPVVTVTFCAMPAFTAAFATAPG